MTSAELRAAVDKIRASAKPTKPCPRCGKPCYEAEVTDPEVKRDLDAIGFDGTCCFKWPFEEGKK